MRIAPKVTYFSAKPINTVKKPFTSNGSVSLTNQAKPTVTFGSNSHGPLKSGWNHLKKRWFELVFSSGIIAAGCILFPASIPVAIGFPFLLAAVFFAGGAIKGKD